MLLRNPIARFRIDFADYLNLMMRYSFVSWVFYYLLWISLISQYIQNLWEGQEGPSIYWIEITSGSFDGLIC